MYRNPAVPLDKHELSSLSTLYLLPMDISHKDLPLPGGDHGRATTGELFMRMRSYLPVISLSALPLADIEGTTGMPPVSLVMQQTYDHSTICEPRNLILCFNPSNYCIADAGGDIGSHNLNIGVLHIHQSELE